LVSAEFRLKKILETLSSCSPEYASASMVFSKVASAGLFAIASISFSD